VISSSLVISMRSGYRLQNGQTLIYVLNHKIDQYKQIGQS